MKNILLILSMLLTFSLVISGCAGTPSNNPGTPEETPVDSGENGEDLTLTLEELAAFDGMNGNKAYIAIDGVIYDVTNAKDWENGNHNGYQAGQDLTKELMEDSPHGDEVLKNLEAVGTVVE